MKPTAILMKLLYTNILILFMSLFFSGYNLKAQEQAFPEMLISNEEYDYCRSSNIIPTSDDGYLIVSCYSKIDDSISDFDLVLMKLDEVGNLLWTKKNSSSEPILRVRKIPNNGILILLRHQSLMLIDEEGNIKWHNVYSTDSLESIYSGANIINDHIYLLGAIINASTPGAKHLLMQKLSLEGELVEVKKFGKDSVSNVAYHISPTADNGYLLTGYALHKNTSPFEQYVLLAKLNELGEPVWAKNITASGGIYSRGRKAFELENGKIVVNGRWEDGINYPSYFYAIFNENGNLINYKSNLTGIWEMYPTSDNNLSFVGLMENTISLNNITSNPLLDAGYKMNNENILARILDVKPIQNSEKVLTAIQGKEYSFLYLSPFAFNTTDNCYPTSPYLLNNSTVISSTDYPFPEHPISIDEFTLVELATTPFVDAAMNVEILCTPIVSSNAHTQAASNPIIHLNNYIVRQDGVLDFEITTQPNIQLRTNVYNLQGKQVFQYETICEQNKVFIHTNSLTPNIYLLDITAIKDGNVIGKISQKFSTFK